MPIFSRGKTVSYKDRVSAIEIKHDIERQLRLLESQSEKLDRLIKADYWTVAQRNWMSNFMRRTK